MKKILLLLFSMLVISTANATWPSKSITIIIPFPAGGPADKIVRTIQPDLEKEFGVQVLVTNMAGANAGVAATHVINRKNDNHTFLFTELEFVVGQAYSGTYLYRNFVPLSTILTSPFALYSNSSSPNLLSKFKAQIQNQSLINVGYVGSAVAWLDQINSPLVMNLIPYKGGAPLFTDVLGSHVEYGISSAGGIWHRVYNDKSFKIVMISSNERLSSLPNVPTHPELGIKGPKVDLWYTFWALNTTDVSVQRNFAQAVRKVVAKNSQIQELSKTGFRVVNLSQEDTEKYINAEITHYEKLAVDRKKK